MANRRLLHYSVCTLLCLIVVFAGLFLVGAIWSPLGAAALRAQDLKPLDKPPDGQTYMGEKVCSSCHFDQNLTWRKTKHFKGFTDMPAKYRADKTCLPCHSTGFEAGGFTTIEATPALAGTSCEACHGPGSKHTDEAKKFTGKELTDAQKNYVRSTIYKILPKNACVGCHIDQTHKKHPLYDKEK